MLSSYKIIVQWWKPGNYHWYVLTDLHTGFKFCQMAPGWTFPGPGYKPGPCSAFSCHVPLLSSHQGQLLNLCHSWPWHFEKNVSPLGFVWCPLVWIQVFMFGRCYPDEVCLCAVHREAHSIDVSYYFDHLGDSSFQTLPMKQLTKMSWDFTELLCV